MVVFDSTPKTIIMYNTTETAHLKMYIITSATCFGYYLIFVYLTGNKIYPGVEFSLTILAVVE
jgi:hypothetical protein